MAENFITNIFAENSRNVKDLEIPLSNDCRMHLILTGKNGSGKTSLLLEINKFLTQIDNGNFRYFSDYKNAQSSLEKQLSAPDINTEQKPRLESELKTLKECLLQFGGVNIKFSGNEHTLVDKCQKGEFLLAFFDAKRPATNLTIPKGLDKIHLQKKYGLNDKANACFIQYIVNFKADRSFAKDDNETEVVEKIDKWFERLENRLKQIFDADTLELRFDRKSYNFDIIINGQAPFNFNNLSDGYSAIISIVTELLLRMEAHEAKSYDLEGIVVIDEIETHLHVGLQKKVLPFLTDFFTKIQFLVTTHSPFVLSSLSNAVICDLETRIVTTDLSAYSYDVLLESYFNIDKYSEEIKNKIIEFDQLTSLPEKTGEQAEQIKVLKDYFANTPKSKYLAPELLVKLQQIELNELNNKKQ